MPNKYADRVQVTTPTTGTGDLTLGSAVTTYRTFTQGGVANGQTVSYLLQEGNAWEIGVATYSSTGPSLTGRTLTASSTGSLLNLAGAGVVSVILRAADIPPPLRFPATQVDDADVNTLDDYEEGTWTPALTGSTTPGTFTYSVQSAAYTKFGRLVMASFSIAVTATSVAAVGNLSVTGLPFTPGIALNSGAALSAHSGITFTSGYSDVTTQLAATGALSLVQNGSGQTVINLGSANLGSTFTLRGTVIFNA